MNQVKSPNKGSRREGLLNVHIGPELHREFAAACALRGETITDQIRGFVSATIAETFASIRPNPGT